MQEKTDYSKFIGKNKLKSTDEGITKEDSPAELSMKDTAEQLIISYIVDDEYKEEPYMSEDKIRMRIRDESGKKIVYDNSLDKYIAFLRRHDIHVTLDEIEEYRTKATKPKPTKTI